VIDPVVFDNIDAYSAPRLVRYECDDFEQHDTGMVNNSSPPDTNEEEVTVEAQYIVGEYEVVILSATESGSLLDWLNEGGYQLSGQSIVLLQEYIEAGQFFLAAKVASTAEIESGDLLSPLQINYDSSVFGLPIRIGTLNAKDAQDLVVYVINNYTDGAAGISNYPEFWVEEECMWESQGEEFGTFYSGEFTKSYEAMAEGSYLTEYSWGGGGCDPCPGPSPSGDDLISLGVNEDAIHTSDYFFTRLHMRYTPTEAHQDLTLYHTNLTEQSQIRYIEYLLELEESFPVCSIGMVDDPGSCSEPEVGDDLGIPDQRPSADPTDGQPDDLSKSGSCGGCNSNQMGLLALSGFWFCLILFRRQNPTLI
jgi:hypothetical protein